MKKLSYIALFCIIASNAVAEPAPTEPFASMHKTEKPLMLENVKQMRLEVEQKMLTEAPKDATQAAAATNMCIEKALSQKSLQDMYASNKAVDTQVKALCKEEKKEEAALLRTQYTAQFAASPEYAAMKTCVDKYKMSFYDAAEFSGIRKNMAYADASQTKAVCGDKKKGN